MKRVHGSLYVHRSAVLQLPNQSVIHSAWHSIPFSFVFQIIKYNLATGAVTFSISDDWNTAPEPTQGDSWLVRADGTTRFMRQPRDPFIYHHKHLFVDSSYTGFDLDKSRARSAAISTVINMKDKPYIGRKSEWNTLLSAHIWQNKKCVKVREILDAAIQ